MIRIFTKRVFCIALAILAAIGLLLLQPDPWDHSPPHILTQKTARGTLYNGFVHKPCAETMSFGYTWFSTTFNIVCDRQDTSPLCTLRIKTSGSNGQSSLGEKSLKLWKLVSRSSGGGGGGDGGSAATAAVTAVATTANIIVKLDDETIIQKHVLDEFIDDFARKPCIVAGIPHNSNNNNNGGDGRYWPLSKLYMFKKSALPPVDSPLWLAKSGRQFMNAEHVQMAHLINVTDPALVCQIDTSKFWHGDFDESTKGWDMRVELKFRYLSSSSC